MASRDYCVRLLIFQRPSLYYGKFGFNAYFADWFVFFFSIRMIIMVILIATATGPSYYSASPGLVHALPIMVSFSCSVSFVMGIEMTHHKIFVSSSRNIVDVFTLFFLEFA